MARYSHIEDISPLPKFGNSGPQGWGFTLWSELIDDEAPHRELLEIFASRYPEARIGLLAYDRYEDFVECEAVWASGKVWVYYETILSHLWLWSPDRETIASFRSALLSLMPDRQQ